MGTIGIDVGATLCKIAVPSQSERFVSLRSSDVGAILARVRASGATHVVVTGGGAQSLGNTIEGVEVETISEFDALASGVRQLATEAGFRLPTRVLAVSVGTGTSIVRVDDGPAVRVGGTAVGGGTMLGLARLLLGTDTFADVVALAAEGDRRRVDLLVGEVYGAGAAPAMIHDLTASNFAKLDSTAPADVAHAIVGMVGETVALVAGALARAEGADAVVYCGTTLAGNEPLAEIVRAITGHFGHESRVLPNGAFCGALGCVAASVASDETAER